MCHKQLKGQHDLHNKYIILTLYAKAIILNPHIHIHSYLVIMVKLVFSYHKTFMESRYIIIDNIVFSHLVSYQYITTDKLNEWLRNFN